MRHIPTGAALALALALAVSLMACGDDTPTQPTSPPPPPPGPTVTLTRIELTGPESVPPGGTAQFTLTGHYSDGTTKNVSSVAAWQSSNPSVVSLSPGGLATGLDRGEASISAALDGRTAVLHEVMVLPPGTYRLRVSVTDEGVFLWEARVTVTRGEGTGQTTTTSFEGIFRLYGVAGEVEIGAMKKGYRDASQRVQVSSHQAYANVALAPSQPRPDVAGDYALEVSASADCSSRLPAEARQRSYTAVVAQRTGPAVLATLSGSTFWTDGSRALNTFTGTVAPEGTVTFSLPEPDFGYTGYPAYPPVFEELTPSTGLSISGVVQATISGPAISGTLNGALRVFDVRTRLWIAECRSTDHQFVLSR